MLERSLLPDFSTAALTELAKLQTEAGTADALTQGPLETRDLPNFLWASIDNDESRDLDQSVYSGRVLARRQGEDSGRYCRRGLIHQGGFSDRGACAP